LYTIKMSRKKDELTGIVESNDRAINASAERI
jgi:hypothetical protein